MTFLLHVKLQSWLSGLIFRLETDGDQTQSETKSSTLTYQVRATIKSQIYQVFDLIKAHITYEGR